MKRRAHKNEPIDQNCAINYRIQENASNETTTKSKNPFGVKNILESVHQFARYKILALICIGWLCNLHSQRPYGGTSITATELSIFISNRAGRDSRDDTQTCKAQDK